MNVLLYEALNRALLEGLISSDGALQGLDDVIAQVQYYDLQQYLN